MNVDRKAVYAALDTERNYQDRRWGYGPHEIAAWVLYAQEYLQRAAAACTRGEDMQYVMSLVRKATALGVAAMEEHGAPPRLEGVE